MKTTEIIVKSMNVSDLSYVDSTTGELVSRVRVEFDAAVPQKRKQLDGSYKDVEDTHVEMKSSALRAKLYSASPLIRDARRNSGQTLDLGQINAMLELAAAEGEIKVLATAVAKDEEIDGVVFAHDGYHYQFAIRFTDDDVARAAVAAEKRKNAAKALLGI